MSAASVFTSPNLVKKKVGEHYQIETFVGGKGYGGNKKTSGKQWRKRLESMRQVFLFDYKESGWSSLAF